MENDDRDDAERDRATLDPDREPAGFQRVDCALNELFATRHLMFVSARPRFLFPWRSFH